MIKQRKFLIALAVTVLSGCATTPTNAQARSESPSAVASADKIDVWALREAMRNVLVSPNGENLLFLKIECDRCDPVIEIRKVGNLMGDPIRLNAAKTEIIRATWITDDLIFGLARQQLRKKVRGPEDDSYSYTAFTYSLTSQKFSQVSGNFGIVNLLPDDPDHLLIETGSANRALGQDDPFAGFRPRSYYKFNIKTGRKKLVMRGSRKFPSVNFDDSGNPRFTTGIDVSSKQIVSYFRNPGDKNWREFLRQEGKEFFENGLTYVGEVPGQLDKGYVLSRNGQDKVGLWIYDFAGGVFEKLVYANPDADVEQARRSSNPWVGNRDIVGVVYPGEKYEVQWFDASEKRLYADLEQRIPNAHQLRVTSRSRDGNTFTVENSGPKDPGSYFLVTDGKIQKLGSQNPYLTADKLADVEYIKYPARDGRTIPAYLTKPNAPKPWPLIVLPHGGPYVTEVIGYREWGQFLAANGYAVLQPQYRGSTGYGWDHYISMWDEHGGKMQDDKDDGALYLAKKGLVAPDKMAMFGWSYGGYAALVASQREPNIYQCVIAGAAVADAFKTYVERKSDFFPYADDLSKQRGAFSGVNPIKNVDKVNVPILMVHGSVDRRVLPYHMSDFEKAMKKAGKGNMLDTVWLEGADHFFNTLTFDHQKVLYTELLTYLDTTCGM